MSGGDHNQAGRQIRTDDMGREIIRATCPLGHVWIAPNKGIGRANTAAWETRHQRCWDGVSS